MMKACELVDKVVAIAKHRKTLYVMGCFGAPMTTTNKNRYSNNHKYNRTATRRAMIKSATADTFGFDCVNLIKAVLWGWTGDTTKTYGGARYTSNGVPDTSADGMISRCRDATSTGWDSVDPGEVVWLPGHIGVYIGNKLVVECSPKWENGVQVTAVSNMGGRTGYNSRRWEKHGHLPYVDYRTASELAPSPKPVPQPEPKEDTEKEEEDMSKEDVARIVREVIKEMKEEADKRPATKWAEEAMEAAKAWGVTDGTRPQSMAERQEVVAMIVANDKRQVEGLRALVRELVSEALAVAKEQEEAETEGLPAAPPEG